MRAKGIDLDVSPMPGHVTQRNGDESMNVASLSNNVGPIKLSFSPSQTESDTSNMM